MRFLALLGIFAFSCFGTIAQELGPKDIDLKTEDVRCVEKNYRHKTRSELPRMMPEQLIDERERHWNYHVGLMDGYGMFTLHEYTGKIGIAIIPVLTKLSNEFKTRTFSKCQENRFFTALAIAADVDDQVVRLRTMKDGRAAILAAEAAIERMKFAGLADHNAHPYNKYPFGLSLLNWVTGYNQHDESMREMMRGEYKIHLADDEFINFVKFLTSTYPTYPSWTPRINQARTSKRIKKSITTLTLSLRGPSELQVTKTMPKHIGIVAGSAEGAALCYRTICLEAQELLGEHNHPEVTMNSIPMARHMPPIIADDWEAVADLMLESAEKVAKAGADFAICPDNTYHQAFEFLVPRSPIPWLHIARVVGEKANESGFEKLGLLGTKYLAEGPVYPSQLNDLGIEREIPDEEDRIRINDIIFKELVKGIFLESSRVYFNEVTEKLKERGCDAVVLGCTEIPLIVRPDDCPLPTLDSTRLLARAAIREAIGETQSYASN